MPGNGACWEGRWVFGVVQMGSEGDGMASTGMATSLAPLDW